ncbi:MAG: lipid-A-disaccharide synthase [Flavobacteriales bacterium]
MQKAQYIYIVCGEASGDLHAANLVAAWKQINPNLRFKAWGGDQLLAQDVTIDQHIRTMSFMGFLEVLLNIRTIKRQFQKLKKELLTHKPDLLILVDYPGFNLRMAKWAHEHGIRVLYYISPTVWAWKQNRVFTIQKYVTQLYCILPFEPDFYAKFGIKVSYFGHPLMDEIAHFLQSAPSLAFEQPILALLPGSRPQELKKKLPLMLAAAAAFEHSHQLVIACANNIPTSVYENYCKDTRVHLHTGHTYELLSKAELALVTSGTATLETALFNVPQVVCYKGSALSIWLARKLVKIKFISLVNLILNEEAVKELIQEACTITNMQTELSKLLPGKPERQQVLVAYAKLQEELQQSGVSSRIAQSMNSYLLP